MVKIKRGPVEIFINRSGEIRSGWKVGLILAMFLLGQTISNYSAGILFSAGLVFYLLVIGSPIENLFTPYPEAYMGLDYALRLLSALCLFGAVVFVLKIVDKKSLKSIGLKSLKSGYKDLFYGLLLGAVSLTAVFLVLFLTDNVTVEREDSALLLTLLTGLVQFAFLAVSQELFARGYCMTAFQKTGKTWLSVLLSSALFMAVYTLNSDVSPLYALNVFLEGILLAFMFVRTGSVWMPIGFRISWDFLQGCVFGFPVDGVVYGPVYSSWSLDENLLNGGFYGPVGGLLITAALILSFIPVRYFPPQGDGQRR